MGSLIMGALASILQQLFSKFATWIVDVMAGLQTQGYNLALHNQATQQALSIMVPIALVVLLLRMLYGIMHDYMVWDSAGTNTTPTNIVRGATLAVVGIAISSLLVQSVWGFFAGVSSDLAGFGVYSHVAVILNGAIASVVAAGTGLGIVMFIIVMIEYGVALIILLIAVFQTFVRIADLALYLVAGPLAAIGLINKNQGSWAGWWKGILVLAGSQTAQLFLIKFGFSALAGMGIVASKAGVVHIAAGSMFTGPLLMIGALLASLKGADFVKQMGGYSTGVGGMASQHGGRMFSSGGGAKSGT